MKRILFALLASLIVISAVPAQTPPPTPPTEKKAEPKKPEKAEQEPRPASQEPQKQDSQKKDAPPPAATQPSPNPITAAGRVITDKPGLHRAGVLTGWIESRLAGSAVRMRAEPAGGTPALRSSPITGGDLNVAHHHGLTGQPLVGGKSALCRHA
jgi:hypothetical protein